MNREDPGYLMALMWFVETSRCPNVSSGYALPHLLVYRYKDGLCPATALDCTFRSPHNQCTHPENPNNMSLENWVLESL